MKVRLMSSGKNAVLTNKVPADLFIDCRGINNPFRTPIAKYPPASKEFQDWMAANNPEYIDAALFMIGTAMKSATSRNSFKSDPLKPLTVCFFCLAGQHRSPGMKFAVEASLKSSGIDVEVV